MTLSESKMKLSSNGNKDFRDWWTLKYGVTEHDSKVLCFLCSEYGICRTFTIIWHFGRHHKKLLKEFTQNIKKE
jgi:hypothetical protein